MIVYLVPNSTKALARELTRHLVASLEDQEVSFVIDHELAECVSGLKNVQLMPAGAGFSHCDIVITIGGDGTILHAARQSMLEQKPLLGVNSGRLGFLTIVEKNELDNLKRLPKGEYTVENRSVLQLNKQDETVLCHALNDIVLSKEAPDKTIELDIFCDDILISNIRGDGVIFSTPTGSTAYSMSAGGPIVDAKLASITVTQICAHIVQTPPIVLAANRLLRVVPKGEPSHKVYISCDGIGIGIISPGEPVTIRQSGLTVPLIQFSEADQLQFIDKKLKGRYLR